jgi:hypothetical protein
MNKPTRWYWNKQMSVWRLWGVWWRQLALIGVSVIRKGEGWNE